MTDNQRRILEMLAEKKISVDEAERLLTLTEQPAGSEAGTSDVAQAGKPKPKYIRIMVEPDPEGGPEAEPEHVNIRVPLGIIRAGIKLRSLMPSHAATKVNEALQSKGIDLDVRNVKDQDVEQLISALSDFEVDVQDGKQKVRIYVE